MPESNSFEYTIARIVPRVERDEFVNVGVVLLCRSARFLRARFRVDVHRLALLAPDLDVDAVQAQLELVERLCAGGAETGPIGTLSLPDRFRWIASPRSTSLQFSPVHCGLCHDPQQALDEVFERTLG